MRLHNKRNSSAPVVVGADKSMQYRWSTTIGHIDKTFFVRRKCNNPKVDAEIMDRVSKIVDSACGLVRSTYLLDLPVFFVPEFTSDIYTGARHHANDQQMHAALTDLNEKLNHYMRKATPITDDVWRYDTKFFKVITDESVTICYVNYDHSDTPMVMTIEYLTRHQVCLIRRLTQYSTSDIKIPIIGAQCISKKWKVSEGFLEMTFNSIDEWISIDYVNMISELVDIACGNYGVEPKSSYDVQHNQLEMSVYKQMFFQSSAQRNADDTVVDLMIKHNCSTLHPNFHKISDEIEELCPEDPCIQLLDNPLIPVIEFSEKEWRFVERYAIQAGLIDENDYDHQRTIDLTQVLMEQRYGRDLRFIYKDHAACEETELVCTFYYMEDKRYLRLVLMYDLPDKDSQIYRVINYINVDAMNLYNCLLDTELRLRVNGNSVSLPAALSELDNSVPKCLYSNKSVSNMAARLLSIYLVIHDRPQRHKMVREEHKRPSTCSCAEKKKNAGRSCDSIVISRILMPAKEVNSYIETMSKSHTGDGSYRNYVVESWERRGHWRRLPNSDKQIWISDTTCNRRKPLTEKEVVIKL